MTLGRRRNRRQLIISIVMAIAIVSILALMVGTLTHSQLLVGTLAMTGLGLGGIWLFDSGQHWRWQADLADYLTIAGLIGFWDAFIDSIMSWAIALIFYWGLSTLVKRARYTRLAP